MTKIYKIIRERGGWCVACLTRSDGHWHRVSNVYEFRGWAQAFCRRMKITAVNYDGRFV